MSNLSYQLYCVKVVSCQLYERQNFHFFLSKFKFFKESTTSSLSWGIIYLIHDQKIQEKLQRELDTAIGSDRLILMEDKNNLPYTNAIVNVNKKFWIFHFLFFLGNPTLVQYSLHHSLSYNNEGYCL